jgi:AraC-like DNA-binding protein
MAADILDKLLITLAVRLHAFAICEIKQGWRLTFAPMEAVTIHYVLAGSGALSIGNGASVPFRPQCMMFVPAKTSQSLGEHTHIQGEAQAEQNCTLVHDALVQFTAGDGSRDILVICGTISATYSGALGLFDHLREPVVVDLSANTVVRHAFEMMITEIAKPSIGAQALTEVLMKQCLILLLREHLLNGSTVSPFFAALEDYRLTRAITSVIERPAAPHTVASMAALAGMSRSSFSDSFGRVFGQSPIEFVQKVRLRLSAQLLSTTDLPVKVIAASVGYSSRSYFSRAFRERYGVDPTTFRAIGGYAEQDPSPVESPPALDGDDVTE